MPNQGSRQDYGYYQPANALKTEGEPHDNLCKGDAHYLGEARSLSESAHFRFRQTSRFISPCLPSNMQSPVLNDEQIQPPLSRFHCLRSASVPPHTMKHRLLFLRLGLRCSGELSDPLVK